MSRRSVDRIVLLGFVILAVLLFHSTASFSGIALNTSAKYIRFLAVSMGLLSMVQLGLSLWREHETEPLALTENYPRFLGLIAALAAFALSFANLGFFIPAALFIPAIALMLGQRNPLVIGGVTVGMLVVVYLIFDLLLGIRLPGPTI